VANINQRLDVCFDFLHLILSTFMMVYWHYFFWKKKQQELAAVFKKIGDKQTCTIGLYELYRITKLYPQVNPTCLFEFFKVFWRMKVVITQNCSNR
jgi:hypothetical protein